VVKSAYCIGSCKANYHIYDHDNVSTCIYICITVRDLIFMSGLGSPPHLCDCPKPGPALLASYGVVYVYVKGLSSDVIVHFVVIDGIVGHHCLSLFS
jgi:hypothetical protein